MPRRLHSLPGARASWPVSARASSNSSARLSPSDCAGRPRAPRCCRRSPASPSASYRSRSCSAPTRALWSGWPPSASSWSSISARCASEAGSLAGSWRRYWASRCRLPWGRFRARADRQHAAGRARGGLLREPGGARRHRRLTQTKQPPRKSGRFSWRISRPCPSRRNHLCAPALRPAAPICDRVLPSEPGRNTRSAAERG
jgi:hypothetical protein